MDSITRVSTEVVKSSASESHEPLANLVSISLPLTPADNRLTVLVCSAGCGDNGAVLPQPSLLLPQSLKQGPVPSAASLRSSSSHHTARGVQVLWTLGDKTYSAAGCHSSGPFQLRRKTRKHSNSSDPSDVCLAERELEKIPFHDVHPHPVCSLKTAPGCFMYVTTCNFFSPVNGGRNEGAISGM